MSALAALAALAVSVGPANGERLVVSLSNHRVMVTSQFVGEELALFGAVEQDSASPKRNSGYDLVITVSGPLRNFRTFHRQRFLGIWVNVDSRLFQLAPAYLSVLSNRPLDAITDIETLRRLQLGLDNFPSPQRKDAGLDESDSTFRAAFIKSQHGQGLYREASNGVTFLAPALFRASISLAAEVPVGTYEVDARLFADGKPIARTPAQFEIYKSGFLQVITVSARDHGVVYGLTAAMIALVSGWLGALVFRPEFAARRLPRDPN